MNESSSNWPFSRPTFQRAIMRGEIAACELSALPISWRAQRRLFGLLADGSVGAAAGPKEARHSLTALFRAGLDGGPHTRKVSASDLGTNPLHMAIQAAALLTEERFAALRAMPLFRRACKQASVDAVELFLKLEPAYQWITKDLGPHSSPMSSLV